MAATPEMSRARHSGPSPPDDAVCCSLCSRVDVTPGFRPAGQWVSSPCSGTGPSYNHSATDARASGGCHGTTWSQALYLSPSWAASSAGRAPPLHGYGGRAGSFQHRQMPVTPAYDPGCGEAGGCAVQPPASLQIIRTPRTRPWMSSPLACGPVGQGVLGAGGKCCCGRRTRQCVLDLRADEDVGQRARAPVQNVGVCRVVDDDVRRHRDR
jgi:hypothetical protein